MRARAHLALKLLALSLTASWLLSAPGAHAAAWLPPANATDGSTNPSQPAIAVDDRGDVFVAWVVPGSPSRVQVSKRPVGGGFEPPQTLNTATTFDASAPAIAADGAGNAVVVWRRDDGTGPTMQSASRNASDSAFGSQTQLGLGTGTPRVAANRAGDVVAAWVDTNVSTFARAVAGTTTGGFGTPRSYTGSATQSDPDVAINQAGDATAVWREATTSPQGTIAGAYRVHGNSQFEASAQTVPGDAFSNNLPRVAVDSTGRAVAVWQSFSADGTIYGAIRSAGAAGSWAQLDSTLASAPPTSLGDAHVVFDSQDGALAAWVEDSTKLFVATRPAGGATATVFDAPAPLGDDTENPVGLRAASSTFQGTVALVWGRNIAGAEEIHASVKPPGGPLGPILTVNAPGHLTPSFAPDVAVDSNGNVAAVWIDVDQSDGLIRIASAIYDVTPPTLTSVTVPPQAFTGAPVSMSANATDDWSQPGVRWTFGDGTTGSGANVTHSYSAPGSYTVTATATDAGGNSAPAGSRQIVVSAPPPSPPNPPPGVAAPVIGTSFNAEGVSGTVLVSTPTNSAARSRVSAAAAVTPPRGFTKFRRLTGRANIPVGSLLDATKGTVSLTLATNSLGGTQTGTFSQGAFQTLQPKNNALTTTTMIGGGNFKSGCRAKPTRRLRLARSRPHRSLFSNVRGRFRTRGRNSTATVRGTQWLVKDTCAGTLTSVKKGVVVVRDLRKHKNKTVRAGHKYLARS